MLLMESVGRRSLTGAHVGLPDLRLVDFHRPPLTLPAKPVLPVASLGEIIIVLVLPPTLVGPRLTQTSPETPPGAPISFCLSCIILVYCHAEYRRSLGILPV